MLGREVKKWEHTCSNQCVAAMYPTITRMYRHGQPCHVWLHVSYVLDDKCAPPLDCAWTSTVAAGLLSEAAVLRLLQGATTMAAVAAAPVSAAPAAARPAVPAHKSTAIIPGWSKQMSSTTMSIECQKISQPARGSSAKECYGVMEVEVMKFVAYCGGLTIRMRVDELMHGPVDTYVAGQQGHGMVAGGPSP
jgi:hypothetical protein